MSRNRLTIGRDSRSDVRIDERWDTVSNRHGEILCEDGQLIYIDHSSNGTVINGQIVHNTSVGIYPGDIIKLANIFELEWNVIERFFPELNRPTVTRNIRRENQNAGRSTIPMTVGESHKGRQTERYSTDFSSQQRSSVNDFARAGDNFGQENEYSQSQIDAEIEKWNWGAFFCSWLWGLFNGIYWPLLIILIAGIPYLGQVCSLCLCVYLGVNGSKMAWRTGRYNSFERFKKVQRNWAIGGVIWFALNVIGSIYLLGYLLTLI